MYLEPKQISCRLFVSYAVINETLHIISASNPTCRFQWLIILLGLGGPHTSSPALFKMKPSQTSFS